MLNEFKFKFSLTARIVCGCAWSGSYCYILTVRTDFPRSRRLFFISVISVMLNVDVQVERTLQISAGCEGRKTYQVVLREKREGRELREQGTAQRVVGERDAYMPGSGPCSRAGGKRQAASCGRWGRGRSKLSESSRVECVA